MSLTICTECFARLRITQSVQSTSSRTFSTTAAQAGSAGSRKTKSNKAYYREATNRVIKKKPRVIPKLPMIGERKALRKRIVLSNTNALEVHGMQDLNVKNMADEEQVGQVLGLNGQLLDQLRELKAFKPTQNWNMFRKPGTLMRRESVALGRTILDIKAGQAEKRPRTVRRIVAGDRSTGKSLMLLQAMSMAFMNEWVVINVPEGMFSSRWMISQLTASRSGVYNCSLRICSDGFNVREAAITGSSSPNPALTVPGITSDYV